MIYGLVKIWARITMFFFFRKIKVVHQGAIPENASVIFAPNHQSAFLDPIVVAVNTKRSPWFLTRASVFKGSFVKSLLKIMHMVPVYRPRDMVDLKTANNATFDFCQEILMQGKSILIFPEGNHGMQKRLRTPLKKGIGRIAFRAATALQNDPDRDVVIVPVGINYEHPTAMRTDLLLIFGEPISIKSRLEDSQTMEAAALGKLREDLAGELSKLMIDIQPKERYDEIELSWQQQRTLMPSLTDRFVNDKALIEKIRNGKYKVKTSKSTGRNSWVRSILLILGFPIWFAGVILNSGWIITSSYLLKKLVSDPHFLQSIKFMSIMVGLPVFTLITSGILYAFTGWFWPFLLLIPLTGLGAHAYREHLWKKPSPVCTKDLADDFLPDN